MYERVFRIFLLALVLLFFGRQEALGIGDTHLCANPLGMESKEIPDSALSVSSYYVHSVGSHQARLNMAGNGGAWCPKEPIAHGVREWLQMSLNGSHLVSGIQIQGRYARGKGQEYTEEFEIEYWREGFSDWRKYFKFDGKRVLPGNSDTSSIVTIKLRPPMIAEKIRILPYSTHRRTICLRLEILGCLWEDGVVEYRMAQGDTFANIISLRDDSYDGMGSKWDRTVVETSAPNSNDPLLDIHEEMVALIDAIEKIEENLNPILTGGLGQLTDKIEGGTPFTMDMGFGLGNGWVGWKRKKQETEPEFVEIIFEFDKVRKFSSLNLFVNNYPSKGVQIMSLVKVGFSVGGVYFNGRGVRFVAGPGLDLALEHARNLSVPLDGRIARFLRIHLYFRDQWIVLSEMYFHSEIYSGNATEEERPDGEFELTESQSPLEIRKDLNYPALHSYTSQVSHSYKDLIHKFYNKASIFYSETKNLLEHVEEMRLFEN